MRTPTLKGDGFILRPYTLSDAVSLRNNINDISIYRNTLRIPHPYTLRMAIDFIKKSSRFKNEIALAIVQDEEVIGGIGLNNIEKHRAEIGYWLSKHHRNKGITTKAVKLLVSYAFNKLKISRVYASVYVKNPASARVLEKAGFKFEGILRKDVSKQGRLLDAKLYAKTKR